MIRWSLLSGVYARGSKISHTGGKCVTCRGLHILEKDNSEINNLFVNPGMRAVWSTYLRF